MTVIAAYVDEHQALMACDQAASAGDSIDYVPTKIFRAGGWLVGTSGAPAVDFFLRAAIKPGPHSADAIAAAWRVWAQAEGLAVEREGERTFQSGLLLARPGEVWVLGTQGYALQMVGQTFALGCGAPEAHGALYATRELSLEPETRLRLAVGAAIHHDAHCAGEIVVEELRREPPALCPRCGGDQTDLDHPVAKWHCKGCGHIWEAEIIVGELPTSRTQRCPKCAGDAQIFRGVTDFDTCLDCGHTWNAETPNG